MALLSISILLRVMRKSFFKFIYTGVTAFSLLSGCSLYNISELRSASSASTDEYSEDDDNKIVSPAIPIAGTYLTYENAAINCNFEEKGDNKFKVICQAMAELKNGTQIVPTAKVASLNLNWSAPKFNNSSLIESYECSLSNNKLVNECEINTVSKTDIHIKYDLQVIEGQENRNISAKVLLPYALSLVGGLVTTMRVIGDVKDSHVLSIPKLPAKSTEVFSDSVCRSASGVYFTHADHVFRIEVRNGKFDENFSVYAG